MESNFNDEYVEEPPTGLTLLAGVESYLEGGGGVGGGGRLLSPALKVAAPFTRRHRSG